VIDDSAQIHPDALIGNNTSIGPYSIIGKDVEIDGNTSIGPHVVIKGPTKIGANNKIYQFSSIGEDPQDKKYHGEKESLLEIGNGNTIREYCSINRGTRDGGGITRIGDNNWIMAYVHIAHDCIIGNNTIFANNSTLAGHVVIDDFVILGGFTGVHQFCRIGKYSLTAISSVVVKDVPPYLIVSGNTAKPSGLNRECIKRLGYPIETIGALKKAYNIIYRDGLLLADAISSLKELAKETSEIELFVEFLEASLRGIAR
jgi:UDP-N-acetylglucosamine acyltransferase